MNKFIIFGLVMFTCMPAFAANGRTAATFASYCSANEDTAERNYCLMFLSGVFDSTLFTSIRAVDVIYKDQISADQKKSLANMVQGYCAPDGLSILEMREVFLQQVKSNDALLKYPASLVFTLGMTARYPC